MPPDPSFNTIHLKALVARWNVGDREAADELLRRSGARLEKLARRMCRAFPNVRECTETQDVLQNTLLRLLATLRKIDPLPATTRDFFNLAAVHIRRELLDLARHFKNKRWSPLAASADSGRSHDEPAAPTAHDFERWERFHEAVELLPVEEREVVGLVFYHGWKQDEIADLFQVNERTIRRRWKAACTRLREQAGEVMSGPAK